MSRRKLHAVDVPGLGSWAVAPVPVSPSLRSLERRLHTGRSGVRVVRVDDGEGRPRRVFVESFVVVGLGPWQPGAPAWTWGPA